jgi:sugar lactone lactonase YvrE
MTTIAGTGKQGFSDGGGSATSAALNGPEALAADDRGNLFIADSGNDRIRQVDLANHTISTFAAVPNIADMILDRAGNLLISHFEDSENGRILRADTVTRSITIVADGRSVSPVDKNARLLPTAMVFDGRLFFMELYREVILKMDASNLLTTAAGNGRSAFSGDNGRAVMASLRYPRAMAFDRSRNLFIADSANNRIRVIRGSIP